MGVSLMSKHYFSLKNSSLYFFHIGHLYGSILVRIILRTFVRHIPTIVSKHLSVVGSSSAGSVGRDLNLQKLHYQYLTTSVAVVLVVR